MSPVIILSRIKEALLQGWGGPMINGETYAELHHLIGFLSDHHLCGWDTNIDRNSPDCPKCDGLAGELMGLLDEVLEEA